MVLVRHALGSAGPRVSSPSSPVSLRPPAVIGAARSLSRSAAAAARFRSLPSSTRTSSSSPSSLLSVALAGGHRTEGVRATSQASRHARWLCVADEGPTRPDRGTDSPGIEAEHAAT